MTASPVFDTDSETARTETDSTATTPIMALLGTLLASGPSG